MKLFLDTSVLLAASASERGASREIFRLAGPLHWTLISTPYAVVEIIRNLPDFPAAASAEWSKLRLQLLLLDDVVTLDRVVMFEAAKDRPIPFSALAWSDILLTLDRGDFATLLGQTFYGLDVLTPGTFLQRERAAGRLPPSTP